MTDDPMLDEQETAWDRATARHLLKLIARDIAQYGGLHGRVPGWVLRKDRGTQRVIHEGRYYELVALKSDRALLVFDEIARDHRCSEGRRLCFAHESYLAWPLVRRIYREAVLRAADPDDEETA